MVKPWETDLTVYADEAALLAGLRQKDRVACTCLVKRFGPRLYRLALQVMGEPDEAEDVLQEAFIQACAHIAAFEGRSSLGTWLHRIVRNAALARLRRTSPPMVSLPDDQPGPTGVAAALVDRGAEPSEAALRQELGATLERAVVALPAGERAAFVLRDLEGLSTKETAAALGISEAAVKGRRHRARAALRRSLGPTLGPERGVAGKERPLADDQERRLLDRVCPPTGAAATER